MGRPTLPTLLADTGSANAIAVTVDGAGYYDGQTVTVRIGFLNTTATTLSISGRTATPVKKLGDQALASGDLEVGTVATFVYDATAGVFQMITPVAVAAPTGATGATGATGPTGP